MSIGRSDRIFLAAVRSPAFCLLIVSAQLRSRELAISALPYLGRLD